MVGNLRKFRKYFLCRFYTRTCKVIIFPALFDEIVGYHLLWVMVMVMGGLSLKAFTLGKKTGGEII